MGRQVMFVKFAHLFALQMMCVPRYHWLTIEQQLNFFKAEVIQIKGCVPLFSFLRAICKEVKLFLEEIALIIWSPIP